MITNNIKETKILDAEKFKIKKKPHKKKHKHWKYIKKIMLFFSVVLLAIIFVRIIYTLKNQQEKDSEIEKIEENLRAIREAKREIENFWEKIEEISNEDRTKDKIEKKESAKKKIKECFRAIKNIEKAIKKYPIKDGEKYLTKSEEMEKFFKGKFLEIENQPENLQNINESVDRNIIILNGITKDIAEDINKKYFPEKVKT